MIDTPQPEKSSAPTSHRAVINLMIILGAFILGTILIQSLKQIGWTDYDVSKAEWADQYGDASITTITFDSSGQLWISLFGRLGIERPSAIAMLTEDGTWKTYPLPKAEWAEGYGDVSITEMAFDSSGQLWISLFFDRYGTETPGAIAMLTKNGTWKTYPLSESKIPGVSVNDLAIDKENRIWVGTDLGLEALTPQGTWLKFLDQPIDSLATGLQGEILVGTQSGKLLRFTNNQWKDYAGPSELGIYILFIDQQGEVWTIESYGFYGFNILKPDGSWIRIFPNVLAPSTVAIDNQNRTWIGANYLGPQLYLCKDKSDASCVIYDASNSGLDGVYGVNDIALDSDNKLWISNFKTLRVLDIDRALPVFLVPFLMFLLNIVLFILGYVYVVRLLPQKSISRIGELGGGLASVIRVFSRLKIASVYTSVFIFPPADIFTFMIVMIVIGMIIGLAAGFVGGKIGGTLWAYISGGVSAFAFLSFLMILLFGFAAPF